MKKIFVLACIQFFAIILLAQPYEGTVDYLKKNEKAIVIEFPYPPSVVEGAIMDKMDRMGYKKKESKGFLLYKESTLPDISSEPADYLFRVERKSRKDKDESVVYMIVSRNSENIIARNDALVNSNVKNFLSDLSPDIEAFNLELQIKDQEELIGKSQKKLKNLQDDQDSMEKKIKKLQDDLKDNSKDQQAQQKEIDKLQGALEELKKRRKS